MFKKTALAALAGTLIVLSGAAQAATCVNLPRHDGLKKALTDARGEDNGGLSHDIWGTIVDRSGKVCAVAFSGRTADSQWPGGRVISAQKANTANAFSLPAQALSTANLYAAVQPGGSLYGLQHSNPVDTDVAYSGNVGQYGTDRDPMLDKRVGGINVFGGGLPLYNDKGELLGALGVSGDTSCADHNIAWRVRHALSLDYVPAGISPDANDQIVFDINNSGKSAGGFGHPACGGKEKGVAANLPMTRKINKKTEE